MNFTIVLKHIIHEIWSENSILMLKRNAYAALDYDKAAKWNSEISIVPVTDDNVYDCKEFEDPEHYVPIYKGMIDRGDFVQYGYLDGKCVFRHAIKCSGDITFENAVIKHIDNKCVYSHYAYCAPQARGKGFLTKSLFLVAKKYFDHDIYMLVYEDNYSSLKSHFRTEYYPYKYLTVKNRMFKKKITIKDISDDVKMEIVSRVMDKKY